MIQVPHLWYSLWDATSQSAKLATQLDIAIEVPLDLLLELLGLLLNHFEGLAVFMRNIRVQLFKDREQEPCDLVFDLDGESLAFSMTGRSLDLLVSEIKVAEVVILLLQACPARLASLLHPRKHLLQLSNDLERVAFDVILVHGSFVRSSDLRQLRQLFIN